MIVTNYNINGLNFSVIYENERVIIYMDVNKEIKNGILRKLIICNTKISSYICNAIVEITTKNIYEDLLLNLYNEVLEVSEMVI